MPRKLLVLAAVLLVAAAVAAWSYYPARPAVLTHDDLTVTSGDIRLAATVSHPGDRRRHPAVVLVHGSGPLRRAQARRDWERLVPEGVVVLAYDKRGVGESSGEYVNVGTSTSEVHMPRLAADALACLRALREHPAVDPARVGFLGSSQAGWIIPVALAKAAPGEVAFAIIRSGPATSVGLEMEYSRLTGDGVRAVTPLSPDEIDRRLADYQGPHGLDTVPLLAPLRTPTLWLLGEQDESIPIRPTLRNLRAAIEAGAPITVKTYPGANHGLMTADGPAPHWDDTFQWMREQRLTGR